MRRIPFSICCLAIIWTPPIFAQDSPSDLPSMNYWEASFDIVRNQGFRDALDISPEQTRQIAAMRSRKDLGDIIRAKSMELFEKGIGRRDQHAEYFAVDDLIKKELSAILLPEQVEKIKLVKMRSKFKTGYAPFGDDEIFRLLKLTKLEERNFRDGAKDAVSKYENRKEKLVQSRIQKLLDSLSLDAKRQLVRYIGNENLPHLPIPPDDSVDSIPFPELKSLGTVDLVTEYSEVQSAIGLSAKQIERLDEVKQMADLRLFEKQTKYKRVPEYADAMREESYAKLLEIIGKDKLLLVARFEANSMFEANPVAIFSRDELIDFLKLSPEESASLRKLAVSETERYVEAVKQLNKDTFDELALLLPAAAQKQIHAYFAGVW